MVVGKGWLAVCVLRSQDLCCSLFFAGKFVKTRKSGGVPASTSAFSESLQLFEVEAKPYFTWYHITIAVQTLVPRT